METRLPPGSKFPAPVQGLMWMAWPGSLAYWHKKYGDIFTVRLGPFGTFVMLASLDDIRAVFHGDDTVFHAGEANGRFMERVLGAHSVLITDEAVHLSQRRRLSGPFHGESVSRLAPLMAEIAARDIETWPIGKKFQLAPRMRSIALDVILQTVIGTSDERRLVAERDALSDLVRIDLFRATQFIKPGLARYWPWSRYLAVIERADALLYEEIRLCRAEPGLESRTDVLAMLVRHREEDGSAISDAELRDQLVTMLLAGHETTATALAWTFERLVRHPDILARTARAAAEGDTAYLDAVITESLRVRPIITDVSRVLTKEVQVGGYTLPAGTAVDPAIILVQRSAEHYPDPLAFDPERFVNQRPDPTIWLPFGGGSRRCLGAAFALTEMRVVLTEVLTRVELATTTAPGEKMRVRHVTLSPHAGGRVALKRRLRTQPAGASLEASADRSLSPSP